MGLRTWGSPTMLDKVTQGTHRNEHTRTTLFCPGAIRNSAISSEFVPATLALGNKFRRFLIRKAEQDLSYRAAQRRRKGANTAEMTINASLNEYIPFRIRFAPWEKLLCSFPFLPQNLSDSIFHICQNQSKRSCSHF